MKLFRDTQRNISDLILETREYAGLQVRFMQKEFSAKLIRLLAGIAIVSICVLLGSMALLFAAFAAAYHIGQATGSIAWGFICVTLAVLLLLLVCYIFRQSWIIAPIHRKVSGILLSPADASATREELKQQVEQSKEQIGQRLHSLTSPVPKASNNRELFLQWAARGMALYQGIRIGMSLLNVASSLFGKRKKR